MLSKNKYDKEEFSKNPQDQRINWESGTFSHERRRQRILKAAEDQFGATGFGSTSTATIAKAAGVSERHLSIHFGTKQKLFEEVVKRNAQNRLAALRKRFFSIPNMPPLDCIENMVESTVLACVDDIGNAAVMAWGLMEMPEFAADVYRTEIGATEALWDGEIGKRFGNSPVRTRLAVHLVPYAAHACMAFGLWLATLRHKPATAEAHARQYAGGIGHVARVALSFPSESLEAAPRSA